MVVEYKSLITYQDLFSDSTNHFLRPFQKVVEQGISEGLSLDFEIIDRNRNKNINPIIEFATINDAKAIVDIYLDIYESTYPYKEMESISEVRKMIQDPNYRWLLFKSPMNNKVLGCFTYHLDFKNKRGYMRGFNISPQYQRKVDAMKALIGSMIKIWSELKDKILIWYSENRTAHTSSQYLANMCGIKPIAFLPNKDVFFNKVESDVMQIAYDLKALSLRRNDIIPKIIPEVINCFNYSNNRYKLGKIKKYKPKLGLDFQEVKRLKKNIAISVQKTEFDYYNIYISFKDVDNYLKFLYTPRVNNIEKVQYKINSSEELYALLWMFKQFISQMNIRYCEVFISAYKPLHQQLFYNFGLKPRGYIPCWQYDPDKNIFEDSILFNWYYGKLNDMILIDEAKMLI